MNAAIIDHLWQSTACVAVAWLLTLVLKRNRAAVRHAIWLAASLKFLVPFSLFMSLGSYVDLSWRQARPAGISASAHTFETWSRPLLTPATSATRASHALEPVEERKVPIASVLFAVWAAGLAAICIYRYTRAFHLHKLVRDARLLLVGRETDALERAHGQGIRLASSASTIEPGVHGILDPALLLPDGIADRLTDAQLESILAHEVAHIRRRDNLWAATQMAVETIFWFYPLVWWMGTRMVDERERACDEQVLQGQTDPRDYAGAILAVCEFYLASPSASVAGITGSNLKTRIETILLNHAPAKLDASRRILLATAVIAALSIPTVLGAIQKPGAPASTPTRLTFDVASIRPHPDQSVPEGVPPPPPVEGMAGGPGPNYDPEMGPPVIRIYPGGRVVAQRATLMGIIRDTYPARAGWRLNPWRVSGGPAWVRSTKYDIEAKSANGKREQALPMLQSLLADRFKLKFHWETRQLPVYELTRAKNGLKLADWKEGSCLDSRGRSNPGIPPPPPPPPPGRVSSDPAPPVRGYYANQPCGIYNRIFDGTTQFFALKTTIAELIPALEFIIKRDVVDKTGYTRTFNVDTVYEDPMFTIALEDQAGLKLESRKGPVSVLVIDSVQKPSEN